MSKQSGPVQPPRIAIVGGGICGLATASALRHRGLDVTLFEQAPVLGEVGAGIFVYPNSLRQLERMGFGKALAKVGAPVGSGSSYRRMDGMAVGSILTTDSSGWNGMYGMHRADLLEALAAALPSDAVRTGHKCVRFEQTDGSARLTFGNGAKFEADLVIAADGIHSTLQRYVVAPQSPEYSGTRAYRGLIARDKLPDWPDRTHQVWMGDGKHFMVFPVRSGTLLNYVGFVPTENQTVESWSAIGDRDELAASFSGWDRYVTELLLKVQSCFWWGLYDRRPLDRWSDGRLLLIGDAAHPMLPHLGQGANQAIEDGVALAVFLEDSQASDVPATLAQFAAFRRKRTDVVQSEARRNGLRYDSRSGSLEQRDKEIASSATFRRWLYDYDVVAAATTALSAGVPASAD
jgi:salicylate hydroxylase